MEMTPFKVQWSDPFEDWLDRLKDWKAQEAILDRIRRLADGSLGDVKHLGDRVSEMRINYGPGYRVYFTRRGREIILLLCGGTKRRQDADIARAKRIAKEHDF